MVDVNDIYPVSWGNNGRIMVIPVVPHKAVAEVSKIGNLWEVGRCEVVGPISCWRRRSAVEVVVVLVAEM